MCSTNTFILLLVLVLLAFIPSQPPHFVKDTVFTTLWELIYLFVVGIVVCYGLFSRRNGNGCDFSDSHGSGVSYVSSFFQDGVGNTYGYDEKIVTQNWGIAERFDFDEFNDSESSRLRNGVENFKCFVGNGNGSRHLNLPVRSLKSRMGGRGSDQEDTISESSDKIKKVKFRGLVPINLDEKFRETEVTYSSPVPWGSRSERMGLRENVGSVKASLFGEGELVPPKLPTMRSEMGEFERKESFRVSFPLAWKSSLAPVESKPLSSRSCSRRFSTEVAFEKNSENNLKGLSEGETEDLLLNRETKGVVSSNLDVKPAMLVKARAISGSFSEMSLKNNSENDFMGLCKGPKEDSMCKQNKCIGSSDSDVRRARLVEGQLEIGSTSEMSCRISSDNILKGSDMGDNGDLLEKQNTSDDFWNLELNGVNVVNGRCSTASFSEINGEKKYETISMDFGNHKKEDSLRRKNNGSIGSLKPGIKPETSVKGLSRGKSVRTIRSNEISVDAKRSEEAYLSHKVVKFIKHCDQDEAGLLKKSAWRDDLNSEADEHSRKNSEKPVDTKNSELRKYRNGESQKNGTCTLVKSESIFMESENFQVTVEEEEHRPCIVGDNPIESNEVDKKAAEFIAKFREQIRLQKVKSK